MTSDASNMSVPKMSAVASIYGAHDVSGAHVGAKKRKSSKGVPQRKHTSVTALSFLVSGGG